MDRETILRNAMQWQARIGEASARWGGAQICAVTKTQSAETINSLLGSGIRLLGENRVQELMDKRDALDPFFEIQLIGSLQTNKVKYIAPWISMVQSVDRDSLAEELSRRAVQSGRVLPVLVQVNIAREPQKGGVDEDELEDFIRRCALLDGVQVRGLMAIMPISSDPENLRPYFRRMRIWFERLRDKDIRHTSMDVLSMGMSDDCIVAAQEGATMVRLGRALFGPRPQKN